MAGKTHPSDWRNASTRTKRLALLALLGVVGGVGLITHFSAAVARLAGPTLIARNAAGETLIANGITLFLIDAAESRTLSLTPENLGLSGPVVSVSSDGRDWYLGDDATGMLYRCDLHARRCVAALQAQTNMRIFRRAHHVAFSADRIFITDSEAHRVLTFNRDGSPAGSTRTSPLALCFPNGIVRVDDHLYVADTNNFRIARLAVAAPAQSANLLHTNLGAPIQRANCNARSAAIAERGSAFVNTAIDSANTVKRDARPPARPDHVWPTSVLRASTGEWWVIQKGNRMRMGEVIRYDAEGRPRGRIDLPHDADPINLIEGRDRILVTDAGLTRVHRVALQGKLSGEWGPPDFHALLGAISSERAYQRGLHRVSIGVLAAGVLAALFVVVLELRRQRTEGWSLRGTLGPVTLRSAPLGRETIWISLDPQAIRRIQRLAWLLGAYLLGSFGILLYLARDLRMDTTMGRFLAFTMGAVLSLVLLTGVLSAVNLGRLPRRRIGVTRDELWYDPGSGDVKRSRWEDVRMGSRGMLVGRELVQIIDGRGRFLFPQAEVEPELLGRLPRTAFLSHWRLQLEALRRGNVALWITAVALAFYLLIMLLRWFQPELVRRMGAHIVELFR
jgi:hypothetical protein